MDCTHLDLTGLLGAGSLLAGFLGALTGLGGGIIVIPLLVLGFGVDLRYAIGASRVSVIATSSASAATYVRSGVASVRIGMVLEVATTAGAVVGASVAARLPAPAIAVVFGLVLLYSAYESVRTRREAPRAEQPDRLATRLRLDRCESGGGPDRNYRVRAVPGGFALMFLAGNLSGLLGIGSGALKVMAMDRIMRIPFRVSTTTSNFMIGVTAAASAGVYLNQGYVDPALAMPVMLGVLAGSVLGARVLLRVETRHLRRVFAAVLLLLAGEMIFNGLTGRM